jgi:hypothetical protein
MSHNSTISWQGQLFFTRFSHCGQNGPMADFGHPPGLQGDCNQEIADNADFSVFLSALILKICVQISFV